MRKPKGYWTKPENQDQAAAQYQTRLAFKRGNRSAYKACIRAGRLEICCSHMERLCKPKDYWTPERQDQAASQYPTRLAFKRGNRSAYNAAWRSGRLDSYCSHMKRQCSLAKRGVYAFEFPGKICYIGLTYNFDRRYIEHTQGKGVVFNYIQQHENIVFEFKKLSEYIDPEEAAKLEAETIEKYKFEGWILLNKAKGGALGSNHIKWPKAECAKKALEYETRWEFCRKGKGAYESARKNGWLPEITSHMPENVSVKWDTIEKVEVISSKCRTRWEFCRKAPGAYYSAWKNKWLDTLFPKTKTNNNKE